MPENNSNKLSNASPSLGKRSVGRKPATKRHNLLAKTVTGRIGEQTQKRLELAKVHEKVSWNRRTSWRSATIRKVLKLALELVSKDPELLSSYKGEIGGKTIELRITASMHEQIEKFRAMLPKVGSRKDTSYRIFKVLLEIGLREIEQQAGIISPPEMPRTKAEWAAWESANKTQEQHQEP